MIDCIVWSIIQFNFNPVDSQLIKKIVAKTISKTQSPKYSVALDLSEIIKHMTKTVEMRLNS
jgi:hypothetical protein